MNRSARTYFSLIARDSVVTGTFWTVCGHVTQTLNINYSKFIKKIGVRPLSKVVQNSILYIYTKFYLDPDVTRGADMRRTRTRTAKKPADSQNVQHCYWILY